MVYKSSKNESYVIYVNLNLFETEKLLYSFSLKDVFIVEREKNLFFIFYEFNSDLN